MFYDKDRVCQFVTHDNNPILGYCVKANCLNRAYCHDCILEKHQDHLDKLKQNKKLNRWIIDRKNIISEIQYTISYLYDFLVMMRNIEEKYQIVEKNFNCSMNLEEKYDYIEFLANLDELKEIIFSQSNIIKHDYNLNYLKIRDFSKRVNEKFGLIKKMENEIVNPYIWRNSVVHKMDVQTLYSDYFKDAEQVFQSEKFDQFIFEPSIPQTNNSVICIEIKKNSLVYMGLCCKEICQSKDSKQIDLTKGYYLIGNNGISYSHTEQQFNCVRQEFQFNGDQIIQIIINQDLKMIIFEQFEMPFYRSYAHVIQSFEMPFDNKLEFNLCFYLCGGAKILSQKELIIDQNEINEVIKANQIEIQGNNQEIIQNNNQQQQQVDYEENQEIRQEDIENDINENVQQEQINESQNEIVESENNHLEGNNQIEQS